MAHPRKVLLIAATSAAVVAASGLVTLKAFAATAAPGASDDLFSMSR